MLKSKFAAIAVSAAVLGGAMVGAAPAEAAGKCVNYNYSLGAKSGCVGYIQQLINYRSKESGLPLVAVDNDFGPKTRDAVIRFQRSTFLKVDGIVGPQVWHLICTPRTDPGPVPGFPYGAATAAGCYS